MSGICLNCGADYYGWALSEERHQTCLECGSLLRVMEYGKFETQNSMSRGRTVIEERPLAREQKKSASNCHPTPVCHFDKVTLRLSTHYYINP